MYFCFRIWPSGKQILVNLFRVGLEPEAGIKIQVSNISMKQLDDQLVPGNYNAQILLLLQAKKST